VSWINSWQRAEAISATNEIIGPDASIEEYNRVLDILERSLGEGSDGVRVAMLHAASASPSSSPSSEITATHIQ